MSQHPLADIALSLYTASAAPLARFVHLYWLVKSLNRHLTRDWSPSLLHPEEVCLLFPLVGLFYWQQLKYPAC